MRALLDTLRISLAGLAIGALALGGCSDTPHDEHAGHDHGSEDHDDAAAAATEVVDEHAGHDHGEAVEETKGAVRTDIYVGILGELTFVPEAGDTKRHPKIHHMQIPTFKREDGTVPTSPDGIAGMRSMTMEFPLAEGVSIDGFSTGDKVRFSFRVNWGGAIAWEMTGIEPIDAGTEIDYSNAKAEP